MFIVFAMVLAAGATLLSILLTTDMTACPTRSTAWFAAAGDREQELRRVDELIVAAAPGIDRQLVPMGAAERCSATG